MSYTYQIPADTEEKKAANKEFCNLRDRLVNEGFSIHYEIFKVSGYYISVRHIYLDKKIYLVKRCNKRCVEIVDLMQEYKNAVNEYKQASQK